MPFWADHALFVALALLFPLRAAWFGYRRLVRAPEPEVPRVRMSLYRQAIVLQWSLSAVTLVVWAWRGRSWAALGLMPRATPAALALAVLAVAGIVLVAFQRRRTLSSTAALGHVRDQLGHVERMLPRRPAELRRFYALAVTAGVCEELLYRGYLFWYLEQWIGLAPAVAVATAIFGFGHLYQGRRGVLTTALVGLVLGVLYLVSGSLYLGMLLHALADAHSGHLAYVAFGAASASEAGASAAALGPTPEPS